MIGKKIFAPKLHYQFSLEAMVPKNHFLRQVDKVLDLRFVRKLVKQHYGTTSNPSIDPVVLIKMMLIGYFYNITSERQLAAQIQLNLAYRWYVGYDIDEPTPHHSVISKARTLTRHRYHKYIQRAKEHLSSSSSPPFAQGYQRRH